MKITLCSVPDRRKSEKLKPADSAAVLFFRADEKLNNVNQVVIIL